MNTFCRARKFVPVMRRNFSGDSHSHLKDVETWKQYSKVMIAGCAVVMAGNIWYISTHEHAHGTPKEVPYMHIRNKPFPWSCSDCELFNPECWKGAKSEH